MNLLKRLLDQDRPVIGTVLEKQIKPLSELNETQAKRLGYLDKHGMWTERGYNRATRLDYDLLLKANKAFEKSRER